MRNQPLRASKCGQHSCDTLVGLVTRSERTPKDWNLTPPEARVRPSLTLAESHSRNRVGLMASGTNIPKFRNDTGVSEIRIGAKEFKCVGATPPNDHPHVFLDMGEESEIICPYCSTLYKYDASLKNDEASPAEAAWLEAS